MKVLVVSDTHRSLDLAREALVRHLPADLLLHLGDFVEDGEELAKSLGLNFSGVRGNNDYFPGPTELELDLNGFKLLLLHGHQFELDPEFDGLFSEAASRGARLALFGHNHQAGIYERAGIFLLNPGSLFLAEPEHSLGVIRAEAGVLELGIYNLKKGAFTDVRKIPGGS